MNLLSARGRPAGPVADRAVTALYQEHALGLTRLAHIMLGDRAAAEDVVQDAFFGLYRRWDFLTGPGKAQLYLRSSVLNGCRSALRRDARVAMQVRATASSLAVGVPPYYIATTATGSPAYDHPVYITVRSTFTGKVLATVTAPRPYGTFNLIQGTADDRTFLVGTQVWHSPGKKLCDNPSEPVRLLLLRYDPPTIRPGSPPCPCRNSTAGAW